MMDYVAEGYLLSLVSKSWPPRLRRTVKRTLRVRRVLLIGKHSFNFSSLAGGVYIIISIKGRGELISKTIALRRVIHIKSLYLKGCFYISSLK